MLEREKKELAAINQAIQQQQSTTTSSSFDKPLIGSNTSNLRATAKQPISSNKRSTRSKAHSSSTSSATLQGIRPECEAVMRAIFCKLDR
jgi:hypothetical protein